jgi:hypothetical protein
LREPWEAIALEGGRVRRSRRFGRPGRVDPKERIWLVIDGLGEGTVVRLNGQELAGVAGSFRMDVTDVLPERGNRIEMEMDAVAPASEVAIEIGVPAAS